MFIPPIGTSGVWTLNAPFATKLVAGAPYTLIGIRKLVDIVASGGDAEADYYTPNNLTPADYLSDVAADASILSLQDGSGDIVYVPSTYMNNYPNIGGEQYRVLALGVNLGLVPDNLDLSNVVAKVASDIKDTIGIVSKVDVVAISQPVIKSAVDAATLEAARQNNILSSDTDYAKYLQMKNERDAALVKVANLEAFILANRVALGI